MTTKPRTKLRIAIISTYTHPTRLPVKEPSVMQSSVPELIAGLCPEDAEIEIFNEKETDVPLDRDWDLVFFSYLHAYYEHTKVLSALLRRRGVVTVAGGRHASYFTDDCAQHFDAVVVGHPELSVPALIEDFRAGRLQRRYDLPWPGAGAIRPARYDLIDFSANRFRLPGIEASRGCPFSCNFCVLTGWETYQFRPIADVIAEIEHKMYWNKRLFGLLDDAFIFLDNNLGGSPRYLRDLCEALRPLRKTWGCALTFNVLRDPDLVALMAAAGCRYIYTGLESLNPESLKAMHKGQNKISEVNSVIRRCFSQGILLSFGLLVGSDGDTNEYLDGLPRALSDLDYFSVTFLGIVCPYPETPFYAEMKAAGRLLPNTISRDYDGYTLCHRPSQLHPSEVIDHFKRLCTELGSFDKIFRHYASRLGSSDLPRYRPVVLGSGLEIMSIRNPIRNPERRYVAGLDQIEAWDRNQMNALGLVPQALSGHGSDAPASARRPAIRRGAGAVDLSG
jgi:radical SAM superfamily enzyme YgiQ (UPF0313 family)